GNKKIFPLDDPDATEVAVWRATPSIRNVAITAPYQQDGRFPTLQIQAKAAFADHSQVTGVSNQILDHLAGFQRTQFSSVRVAALSVALEHNLPLPNTDPPLSAFERQGKET